MPLNIIMPTGKIVLPKVLLYGDPGRGKSTLGAGTTAPVFADLEGGCAHLNVPSQRIASWDGLTDFVAAMANESHPYRTMVIDSITAAEALLMKHICDLYGCSSITSAAGGYGAGYTILVERWLGFLRACDAVRQRGITVFLIGHSRRTRVEEPGQPHYDRYEPALYSPKNGKTMGVMEHTINDMDIVSFLHHDLAVSEADGKGRNIAHGGDQRMVYSTRHAICWAKNRYGLTPNPMPAEGWWSAVRTAVKNTFQGRTPAAPETTAPAPGADNNDNDNNNTKE